MTFYLGTSRPHWLAELDIPLFISRRELMRKNRRTFPRARAPWALDSSGFTELSMYGEWRTTVTDYACQVQRVRDEIGRLEWAAPQDWMCEPAMLERTGLNVAEHQRRTLENFQKLEMMAPHLPWVPVLQGWEADDYLRHAEMYERAGIALAKQRRVAVGTVCRRQATDEVLHIMHRLRSVGARLHAFGVKSQGLAKIAPYLESSDSHAWSFRARRSAPLPGCTHQSCCQCQKFALQWRARVLAAVTRAELAGRQIELGLTA